MAIPLPRRAGPWRPLFRPQRFGHYVNDHSLVRGPDGLWHLFGITSHAQREYPDQERYFVHAAGALDGAEKMRELGKVCDNGVRAWAPAVIAHDERYHMYFGPSPTRFATSDELSHWMENTLVLEGAPLDALHRDHFVLAMGPSRWLMYGVGIHRKRAVVSVFESTDLVHWRFLRYALTTTASAPLQPPWGAAESPFVVPYAGGFFLFLTFTDSRPENYHDTLVFWSADPTYFGEYTGNDSGTVPVTRLWAHAPEIICDDGGQWHITTCGWRNHGTAVEGGVAIAPLVWEDSGPNVEGAHQS